MMNRITLSVSLTVKSPFLFPGLAAAPFGLDASALRDRKGNLLIPQDQMRGVLRHALLEVATATDGKAVSEADLASLFGTASGDAAEFDPEVSNAPMRGRLLLGDLKASNSRDAQRAVRVKINPKTRAAEEGALMMVELATPYGKDVEFTGTALLFAADDEAARWLPTFRAAASYISAIGAMKTAGFGEVVDYRIEEMDRASLAPAGINSMPPERRTYHMRIDRPFLVNSQRAADNAYIGSEIIPGAAIKGALARKLALCGEAPGTNGHLTALSLTHARPLNASKPLPLSLVLAGDKVGDALEVPYGKGAFIGDQPARFLPDWKEVERNRAQVALRLNRKNENIDRDVRMHVAIDRASGSAKENLLYVTSAVDPADQTWVFDVDFANIEDAKARKHLAASLESGLDGLGSTGASATITPVEVPPAPKLTPVHWREDAYAVILETSAVMVSPDDAADPAGAYAAYWNRVCPGAELLNHFATQRLAGGFAATRNYNSVNGYRPFWLTEAGSVFLLAGNIEDQLTNLARRGLPAPQVDAEILDWQRCLYQPENGYGRIVVDYDAELTREVTYA